MDMFMVIQGSQNKITDFFRILAWLCRFSPLEHWAYKFKFLAT